MNKLDTLSPELRKKIFLGERKYTPSDLTPVTNYLVHTKRHCNGGKTVDAGLWLRDHCDSGGKIYLSMSGAGSSFQQGIIISELIRAGKIAGISVTGANLEESLYRLVANEHYAYIPDYVELTPTEEKELDHKGFRRITDTFLPEDESTRVLLPIFEKLWRDESVRLSETITGIRPADKPALFWHEYFFKVLEEIESKYIGTEELANCWLYWAWKHKIDITVGGVEDSTMGNIFAYYSYNGKHPFLSRYAQEHPISPEVVAHSFRYMHKLAEWYQETTQTTSLAFLQLGGGIAGDFPICVVPHLKKDYLADLSIKAQEAFIKPWAGFIEIHSSPMSFGSYSGAGFKEKITWSKVEPDSFGIQIFGDYTEHFPDIAAIVLRR
jgi:deoxyhypusine synthase